MCDIGPAPFKNPEVTNEGWYTLRNALDHAAYGEGNEPSDWRFTDHVKDVALGYQSSEV